jgi:hypothetical protein
MASRNELTVQEPVLTQLSAALREAADPARAPAMQASMKWNIPYDGVPTPVLRQVCKQVFASLDLLTAAVWREQALAI